MRARPLLFCIAALVAGCPSSETKEDVTWIYTAEPKWPSRQLLPQPAGHWFVTSNAYDDTLSFLDADTLAVVARIPIGLSPAELEGPHHVVLSPDGQFLYTGLAETVPNSGSGPHGSHGDGSEPGYIVKIRASDARVVGSVRVDRNPGDLILSPDGTTLWTSHFDVKRIEEVAIAGGTEDEKRSAIAVIDTETMTLEELVPVCPAEHGMALSPGGETLYVACYGSDQLAVVDVTQPGLPHQMVDVGAGAATLPEDLQYGPYALTFDPDGETLWVSCWHSSPGSVRAFDTVSETFDGRVLEFGADGFPGFGGARDGLAFFPRQQLPIEFGGPDPTFPDDRVLVTSAGTIVAEHVLDPADCVAAHQAYPDPTRPGKALVVCEGDHLTPGSLIRLDLETGTVEETAEVGIFPDAVVYVGTNAGVTQ